MTDLLHKPNGWDSPLNQMSDEEWKEYFRLREDLDVEMSVEEMSKAYDKVDELLDHHKENEAFLLMKKIPFQPRLAYALKLGMGLKEVMTYNLSLAKKEYPNEF